jgi:hypothetical protein
MKPPRGLVTVFGERTDVGLRSGSLAAASSGWNHRGLRCFPDRCRRGASWHAAGGDGRRRSVCRAGMLREFDAGRRLRPGRVSRSRRSVNGGPVSWNSGWTALRMIRVRVGRHRSRRNRWKRSWSTPWNPPRRTRPHWSRRSMAERSGLSASTIGRIWHAFELKPHRTDGFKLSNDPMFVERSTTSSGCTSILQRSRPCSALTRSRRSRPSRAPSPRSR